MKQILFVFSLLFLPALGFSQGWLQSVQNGTDLSTINLADVQRVETNSAGLGVLYLTSPSRTVETSIAIADIVSNSKAVLKLLPVLDLQNGGQKTIALNPLHVSVLRPNSAGTADILLKNRTQPFISVEVYADVAIVLATPPNAGGGGGGGSGLTSVGLTLPSIFSSSNNPLTANGNVSVSLVSQAANRFFAAPDGASGVPSFRLMTAADVPSLDASKIGSGTLPVARGGTGASTLTGYLKGNGTSAFTASATVPLTDLASGGAANGNLLSFNGVNWSPLAFSATNGLTLTSGVLKQGGTFTDNLTTWAGNNKDFFSSNFFNFEMRANSFFGVNVPGSAGNLLKLGMGSGTGGEIQLEQLGGNVSIFSSGSGGTDGSIYLGAGKTLTLDALTHKIKRIGNTPSVGWVWTTTAVAGDGTATMELAAPAGGGGGSPGGTSGQFQYNNSGSFAGAGGLTYAAVTGLTTASLLRTTNLRFQRGTDYSTIFTEIPSGGTNLTLPSLPDETVIIVKNSSGSSKTLTTTAPVTIDGATSFVLADKECVGMVYSFDNDDYRIMFRPGAGGGGGSTPPGGSDTHVQFNDGGVFNGESTFAYDKTANRVTAEKFKANSLEYSSGSNTIVNTHNKITLDIDFSLSGDEDGAVRIFENASPKGRTITGTGVTFGTSGATTYFLEKGETVGFRYSVAESRWAIIQEPDNEVVLTLSAAYEIPNTSTTAHIIPGGELSFLGIAGRRYSVTASGEWYQGTTGCATTEGLGFGVGTTTNFYEAYGAYVPYTSNSSMNPVPINGANITATTGYNANSLSSIAGTVGIPYSLNINVKMINNATVTVTVRKEGNACTPVIPAGTKFIVKSL